MFSSRGVGFLLLRPVEANGPGIEFLEMGTVIDPEFLWGHDGLLWAIGKSTTNGNLNS